MFRKRLGSIFKNGFTITELAIVILIITILVIAMMAVANNKMRKVNGYSYYMAYKIATDIEKEIVSKTDYHYPVLEEDNEGYYVEAYKFKFTELLARALSQPVYATGSGGCFQFCHRDNISADIDVYCQNCMEVVDSGVRGSTDFYEPGTTGGTSLGCIDKESCPSCYERVKNSSGCYVCQRIEPDSAFKKCVCDKDPYSIWTRNTVRSGGIVTYSPYYCKQCGECKKASSDGKSCVAHKDTQECCFKDYKASMSSTGATYSLVDNYTRIWQGGSCIACGTCEKPNEDRTACVHDDQNVACSKDDSCPTDKPHKYNGECHICPSDKPHYYDGGCHACHPDTPKSMPNGACCPTSAPYLNEDGSACTACDIKGFGVNELGYCVECSNDCDPEDPNCVSCGGRCEDGKYYNKTIGECFPICPEGQFMSKTLGCVERNVDLCSRIKSMFNNRSARCETADVAATVSDANNNLFTPANYSVKLSNGAIIYIGSDLMDLGAELGINDEGFKIYIDVDGKHGDGILNKDVFLFYLTVGGKVIPAYNPDIVMGANDPNMLGVNILYSKQSGSGNAIQRESAKLNDQPVSFVTAACMSGYMDATTPYCTRAGVTKDPNCTLSANCTMKVIKPYKKW